MEFVCLLLEDVRNAYKILVYECEGKRTLGRFRRS
jgi:hypothetical protein